MQALYITHSPTGLVGNSKILGESSGSENPGSIRDQGKIFECVPVLYIFKIPMAVESRYQSKVDWQSRVPILLRFGVFK